MNLLSLICCSWWSQAGTGRVHRQYKEVIGDGEQLCISNLSESGNGINLDLLQWRGSCNKCRKQVVRGAGIVCGNFYVGRGQ